MVKKIFALLLASVMCFALVACGGSDKGSDATSEAASEAPQSSTDAGAGDTAASGDNLNINVILKTTASEYWGYVVAGAQAYSTDHPEVKVEVQGAASETSYDEQLNIIETNLASGKFDGFVIAPLQADMVVNQIAGQTVPIIAVDTKIEAPEVLSFVGTGNEAAATEGGKAAVEKAKAAGWE